MNLRKYFHQFQFRQKQKQWQRWQLLPAKDVTINTQHGLFSFSSHDTSIGQQLYVEGKYQEECLIAGIQFIKEHKNLKSGYILDIGANIGTVAIKFIRDGIFTRAVAFEPEHGNFTYLQKNIQQNNLESQIIAQQVGLSSQLGEMNFELAVSNSGDHRIRFKELDDQDNSYGETNRKLIKIPVQPLDYALERLHIRFSEVSLIHIDVQGHEWYVLQGARQLLKESPPLIMELWPYGLKRSGTLIDQMFDFIGSHYSMVFDLNMGSQSAPSPVNHLYKIYDGLRDLQFTDVLLL